MTGRTDLTAIPWTSLRAFEAASRLGSFKAAAAELSVTPTAISHQVKRLETHLGLALFERLHRSLRLTAAGDVLGAEAQSAFLRLEHTLHELKAQGRITGADSLTVSAVPSFAIKWLAPRLHGFLATHPRTGLRVVADEGLVDFRRDRIVDVALRYGPGPYGPDVHAERLWPAIEVVAVCAPALAEQLRSPADLFKQTLIRTAPPPARERSGRSRLTPAWLTWFAAAGFRHDEIPPEALEGPLFSASQLAIEIAMAGQGVALAPAILVDRDISSGRLTCPFATTILDGNSFWVLSRIDRMRESRIRAFIKWIKEECSPS